MAVKTEVAVHFQIEFCDFQRKFRKIIKLENLASRKTEQDLYRRVIFDERRIVREVSTNIYISAFNF
jgi:hypothetical protein